MVGGSAEETVPFAYKVSNGRIEIKPRLKYELIISLHVLKFAEDHHQLFVPWAQQMRKDLTDKTLHDATTLIENTHEWQLCSLVQEYDGPDTIGGLAEFIKSDSNKTITKWASMNGERAIKALGLSPEQFPRWSARRQHGLRLQTLRESLTKKTAARNPLLTLDQLSQFPLAKNDVSLRFSWC